MHKMIMCGKPYSAAAEGTGGTLECNHWHFQEKQGDNHDIVQAIKISQFEF